MQKINPPTLHETHTYHHVTIVPAGPMAYLAGQGPLDRNGAIVGEGDPLAQVDQIVANTMVALEAAGAGPADVVRAVVYVVSQDQQVMAAVWRRFVASPLAPAFTGAATMLGVAQLVFPGMLVELEVTASIPTG